MEEIHWSSLNEIGWSSQQEILHVIIATATASRNWASFSQWNSPTTPPRRKGTIARPLPKTKAPDFRKKFNLTTHCKWVECFPAKAGLMVG
jgi:hypothetical protein